MSWFAKKKACGPYQRYCRCSNPMANTTGPYRQWLCGNCAKFFHLATKQRLFPPRGAAAVPCGQQPNPLPDEFFRTMAAAMQQMSAAGMSYLPTPPMRHTPIASYTSYTNTEQDMMNVGYPQPMEGMQAPPPTQHGNRLQKGVQFQAGRSPQKIPPAAEASSRNPHGVFHGRGQYKLHRRGHGHHRERTHRRPSRYSSSGSSSSGGDWGRADNPTVRRYVEVWWPDSSVVVRWADVGGVTSSFVCLRVAGW